ncbi:PhoX family phosphatase [Chitinimonas viridis]|uniref:PhoX family phosphatase n=1 Tax=Chitinimonas viridis TaxID=664880 RepID=A0ABT8BB94_9NEIS|nr:PhoX family phosphatase [Chitinimonas viridis]MDN3578866.1 PhoX family phosphatase [Chitinimonas viridis]
MSQFDDNENISINPSRAEHFNQLVDRVVSRRGILKSGLGLGAVAFLGGNLAACSSDGGTEPVAPVPPQAPMLNFKQVSVSSGDAIVVPEGYVAEAFVPWGTPLVKGAPAWKPDGSNTGADQALQMGDNHDGMHYFPIGGTNSSEGLLVMNHEYINPEYFFAYEPGQTDVFGTWTLDKVRKAQHAHGVSVVHIKKDAAGKWQLVVGSAYNRRIHGNTPMLMTGPAAGHALLKTSADPFGSYAFGTLNNCGNGYTPWGSYITCEENFNGYFGTTVSGASQTALMKRYGLSSGRSGYRWEDFDNRFDWSKEPNESNRFGWIVEIDPFDPTSTPKKRTALGRFKHENAAYAIAADGRVVVYMGDDQAGEFVYKFVSDGKYDAANPTAPTNRNLLESGKLYVARFSDGTTKGDSMGTGEWLLLDKEANASLKADSTLPDQASVLINARQAGTVAGATPMDRPEWVSVHPTTKEVYLTLTNNSGRSTTDDANPRTSNVYGQIIRWRETGGDAAALTFEWDHFVLAGNPSATPLKSAGSSNINAGNTFNSPDGLAFDHDGRLWIQTDGSAANTGNYAGQGNNQMLVADPKTREIRRFLVGPSGCEITGITFTPDMKTLFINVQHPGELGSHPNRPTIPTGTSADVYTLQNPLVFSKWPDANGGRPRSATVIITKADGGKIGS